MGVPTFTVLTACRRAGAWSVLEFHGGGTTLTVLAARRRAGASSRWRVECPRNSARKGRPFQCSVRVSSLACGPSSTFCADVTTFTALPACCHAKRSMFCAICVSECRPFRCLQGDAALYTVCFGRPCRRLRGVVALNTVCFLPFVFASGDPFGVCGGMFFHFAFTSGDPVGVCGVSWR